MEIVLSNAWHVILRFDEGEEVMAAVADFAAQEGISAAWLSAIGSCKEVELGYYGLAEKKYYNKVVTQELEVLDASGTIAQLEGKPALHLHGVLGDKNYQTIGGHIHRLVANATIEVFIHKIEGEIKRTKDEATGLNLLTK